MTCSKCGRKVRGRPASSGICPQCRREMTAQPIVQVPAGEVQENVDLPEIGDLDGATVAEAVA